MGIPNVLIVASSLRRDFDSKQHVIVPRMMKPVSSSSDESQASRSWWRSADAPAPIGVYSERFSPSVTLLSGLFLVMALALVVWLSAWTSKVDQIESPEQALSLMVSRTRDVEEGLKRAPQWEQQLFA